MIRFSCNSCGNSFAVDDSHAGRKAKCKFCGAVLVVPQVVPERLVLAVPPMAERTVIVVPSPKALSQQPPLEPRAVDVPPIPTSQPVGLPPTTSGGRSPMRIRRLTADAEYMTRAFRNFPLINVRTMTGKPPDTYQVEYRVKGLAKGAGGTPVVREQHLVEIQLTSEYPRQSPKCRILTPIFHPNFDPTIICVGDHWAASLRLADLVIRIGEMIAYQAYNIKSPLDGDAAMWADLNKSRLPIDSRDMQPPGLD